MSRRDVVLLALAALLMPTLVMVTKGVVPTASALYSEVLPSHPYFLPQHALLLYVAFPFSVVAALAFVILPGALLVLITGGTSRASHYVVRSFGAAFAANFLVLTAIKLTGLSVSGWSFSA